MYRVCALRSQVDRQEGLTVRKTSGALLSGEQGCELTRLTLPDEGLAGVQQDVTALHYHPLYGQVLPDVLRVTHLVMHYSGRTQTRQLVQYSISRCIRKTDHSDNQKHTWTAPLILTWRIQDSCVPHAHGVCVPITHAR